MNDPYKKFHESIINCLTKLGNMIVWLAKRTLSVRDYMEFVNEFSEDDKDNNPLSDEVKGFAKQ